MQEFLQEMQIWSYLRKSSLTDNLIFCAVFLTYIKVWSIINNVHDGKW